MVGGNVNENTGKLQYLVSLMMTAFKETQEILTSHFFLLWVKNFMPTWTLAGMSKNLETRIAMRAHTQTHLAHGGALRATGKTVRAVSKPLRHTWYSE